MIILIIIITIIIMIIVVVFISVKKDRPEIRVPETIRVEVLTGRSSLQNRVYYL
jgi:hypothetical protein